MTAITRRYVEFTYPGLVVAESSSRELPVGNSVPEVIPDGAVAYQVYDIFECEEGGIKMKSGRINVQPRHLIIVDGPYTKDEVLARWPHEKIMAANAGDQKRGVAQVRTGNWVRVHDDDVLVDARSLA